MTPRPVEIPLRTGPEGRRGWLAFFHPSGTGNLTDPDPEVAQIHGFAPLRLEHTHCHQQPLRYAGARGTRLDVVEFIYSENILTTRRSAPTPSEPEPEHIHSPSPPPSSSSELLPTLPPPKLSPFSLSSLQPNMIDLVSLTRGIVSKSLGQFLKPTSTIMIVRLTVFASISTILVPPGPFITSEAAGYFCVRRVSIWLETGLLHGE